jgi:hypothetical protein
VRATTRAALVTVPVAVLAGALIASARLHHGFLFAGSLEHPIPAELLFPGSARALEAAVFFATLVTAAMAYVVIVRDAVAIPRGTLTLSAACAALAALSWPLVFSADVHAYAAYGLEVLRGVDPYHAPVRSAIRAPELIEHLRAWSGKIPRDIGGPLFTALCSAAAASRHPVALLRLVAVMAYVACVRFWPRNDPRGAALFGAHPLVLWSAAEGHNDVLAFALVVAAWRFTGPGGLALRLAAMMTKAFAVVPLALELLRVGRSRVSASVALLAVVIASYLPVLLGIPGDLARGEPRELRFSAVGVVFEPSAPIGLRLLAGVLAAGLIAGCCLRRRDGGPAAALTVWALFPAAYPWWAVWLVAVVARRPASPAAAALLAVSFSAAASYLPVIRFGPRLPPAIGAEALFVGGLLAVVYGTPLAVLGVRAWLSSRNSPSLS